MSINGIFCADYGVLHSWECKRLFKLQPNDPEDLHYLHKDGMMYVMNHEPYNTEKYCIENVMSPSGLIEVIKFNVIEFSRSSNVHLNI